MKIKLPLIGQIKTGADATEESAPTITTIETPKKTYDVLGGLLSFGKTGLSTERTISKKILEANKEWVYRNNDVIAQEVSKMEFELFSINLKAGEIEYTPIEDHPLLDLLDKFNSRTTRTDGLYMTQSHKKLTGDAFWLLSKNGAVIDNIFVLPPDKIELVLADPTDAAADLIKAYLYEDVIDKKKISVTYQINEIIHFKKPNPKNPFRGYGAVEALADTIDADNLTNEVQRNFFDKGAISNFVLTTDNKVTEEQIKRIKAEMRAYQGARNAFNTMIFGNGIKPSDIGFSNKDMDFLNLLEWYRDKIMIGFGNTKASIGIIDDVNRSSFAESHNSWLRGTIKPDMDAIVNTLNEFLVPLFGENLILGYKDPVPEDATNDIEEASKLKLGGIIQINEARQRVGLEPVVGGDVFAPNTNVAVASIEIPVAPEPNQPPIEQPPVNENKRIYRTTKFNLPDALKHLDVKRILRKQGIYVKKRYNQEVKEASKPIIQKLLNSKKEPYEITVVDKGAQLTEDVINAYYEKQIQTVDTLEVEFRKRVYKLLTKVKDQALSNFKDEIKTVKGLKRFIVKKELFDEEALQLEAQLDLTPILMQEIVLAGQEAYRLIGISDTYTPFKLEASVREAVDKFATSMLSTDKAKLASIISSGIADGSTITEIRDSIDSIFGQYTKMQAELITRTEVLRASNMAAQDAFEQSGVVEGKQWITAGATDECAALEGQIVELGGSFYASDSEFADGDPPLHPNCRCIIVPIVTGTNTYKPNLTKTVQEQYKRIAELEGKSDKRTKAFKELKRKYIDERANDAAYIKALEKHLGVNDEQP